MTGVFYPRSGRIEPGLAEAPSLPRFQTFAEG
jgi:hypothetical protein